MGVRDTVVINGQKTRMGKLSICINLRRVMFYFSWEDGVKEKEFVVGAE